MSISNWTRGASKAPSDGAADTVSPFGGAGAISDTCFAQIDAYWHALCAGRTMPDRADVDPRGISSVLDRTFLLERMAPGLARFRLAGTHLADLMGMDVRGMPASCFVLSGARAEFADALEAVFSGPAKVDLWLTGPSRLIGKPMVARMMLLPVRDCDGAVTRALGCLSASRRTGGTPSRFNIVSDNRMALHARPDHDPTPTPAHNAQRPAFRVIDGGRDG